MRRFALDHEDIDQAIEIACGDSIGSEFGSRRTASEPEMRRLKVRVKRVLEELPADVSIGEVLELLEE